MAKRILMVGDNHGIDPSLLRVLGAMEAELDVAQNPVAAYPKLWKGGYDMVVAETGPDAVKQEEMLKVLWQARRGCPRAEIIIIADFCGPDLAQHAQELGAAFCLKKDTAPEMLEKALHSLGLDYRVSAGQEPREPGG
ncbi:MAG TPA: hypothetical protein DDW31_06470 [candidate division Zixibacteria bacterium]|nr:hypothetical protein [candidate division Zixibacteria bacterium]